jgi:hypothetical protein
VVVAKLYGGLGNQMFQYAAAIGVADRLATEPFVDASWFRRVGPQVGRTYGLSAFGIEPRVPLPHRLRLLLQPPEIIREDDLPTLEALAPRRGSVLLDGYWQSPAYFTGSEARVREALRFRTPPTSAHVQLLARVGSSESVSVHVRRGDYTAPKRQQRFGLLSIDYYRAAMEMIATRVADAWFLVFSDDLDWCREAFADMRRLELAPPVSDDRAHEHLRMMAACKHHVTANSSFSWWGAWLEQQPDSLVVAPKTWYADPSIGEAGLVPPDWIRL